MTDTREIQRRDEEELAELRRRLAEYEAAERQWRRVESALRESERRRSTLLSNLPGMAYRCRNDADWTMEFVSEGCFPLTGRHRSEVLHNRLVSWNDVIHPDDRQNVWDEVQRAVSRKEHFQLVYRIITGSGGQKWVWEQGVGVFAGDGRLEALEGFITDITERVSAEAELQRAHDELEERVATRTTELAEANRQLQHEIAQRKLAEDALRQNHDELRAIYDGVTDGLVIIDVETQECLRANTIMPRMLGYPEDQMPRTPERVHSAEELPSVRGKLGALVSSRLAIAEGVPYVRKDGSVLYADVTGSRIEYHGRPCLLAFVRDTTERIRTQAALLRERQTLWHMLRASDHERQVIAYEIHDGLAQQLAAAIMQFQSFQHFKDLDPAAAKTACDAGLQMLRQAHAEARRLISGVRPPILDESGITAAVAHLVHDQRETTGAAIEFVGRVSFDRLPKILENAIYRIAQEALANACKHSQSDKIRVSLVQKGELVRLEVEDQGVGFDPNVFRGDRFGLEGIRERARLLGGTAVVDSAPGRGTTVKVTLPLAGGEMLRK